MMASTVALNAADSARHAYEQDGVIVPVLLGVRADGSGVLAHPIESEDPAAVLGTAGALLPAGFALIGLVHEGWMKLYPKGTAPDLASGALEAMEAAGDVEIRTAAIVMVADVEMSRLTARPWGVSVMSTAHHEPEGLRWSVRVSSGELSGPAAAALRTAVFSEGRSADLDAWQTAAGPLLLDVAMLGT